MSTYETILPKKYVNAETTSMQESTLQFLFTTNNIGFF